MGNGVTKLGKWCRQLALFSLVIISEVGLAQMPPGTLSAQTPTPQTLPPVVSGKTVEMGPRDITLERYPKPPKFMLQDDLRLSTEGRFLLKFQLQATLTSGKAARVPDGWYLLTAAVIYRDTGKLVGWPKPSNVFERYVTSDQHLIQITNGAPRAAVPLRFRFESVSATTMNQDLWLELLPLSARCTRAGFVTRPCVTLKPDGRPDLSQSDVSQILPNYRPYRMFGTFLPFQAKLSGMTIAEDEDARAFLGNLRLDFYVRRAKEWIRHKRAQEQSPILTPRGYADANGLRYFDLNDPAIDKAAGPSENVQRVRQMLRQLLSASGAGQVVISDEYRRLLPVVTELLDQQNKRTRWLAWMFAYFSPHGNDPGVQTASDPRNFYMSRVVHIGALNEAQNVSYAQPRQFNYQLAMNAIRSRSRTAGRSTTFTVKPIAMLPKITDLFGMVNMSVPIDFVNSVYWDNNRSKIEQGLTSMAEAMHFTTINVMIPAVNARPCVEISLTRDAYPFYDFQAGAKNGVYICGDVQREMTVPEMYAHVYSTPQDSSFLAAYDPGTQSVNRALRGDTELMEYYVRLRQSLTEMHGPELVPAEMIHTAEAFLKESPRSYPRTVRTALRFVNGSVPGFAEKAIGNYSESFMDD